MPGNTYKGIISPTFDNVVARFLNGGGQLTVINSGEHSNYSSDYNRITINMADVAQTARVTGVSVDQAYAQTLVHEFGHFADRFFDTGLFANPNLSKEQACYMRESAASIWATTVATEVRASGGAFSVAGVKGVNDLFSKVTVEVNALLQTGWVLDTKLDASNQFLFKAASDLATIYKNDPAYKAYCTSSAFNPHLLPQEVDDHSFDDNFGYGGSSSGGGGCVEVSSILPCGRKAGDIKVGDVMQLADESSLVAGQGTVTYSERKSVPGYRITTASGVTLVCSDSAPIPTPEGLVLAPDLLGKQVAVRRDGHNELNTGWEVVNQVDSIGTIEVQHITVGDKCFWAGEKADAYILHHNLKQVDGGGGGGGLYGDDGFPSWWDSGDYLNSAPLGGDAGNQASLVLAVGTAGNIQFDMFGRPINLPGGNEI